MTVKQLEAQLRGGGSPQDAYIGNSLERELLPIQSPAKIDVIRKKVVEHAQQDPETVARLVRAWINGKGR
jgi:flagellar biosynthesis/type III secretory pathway M-ring protein FliF/YscJ